GEAGAHVVARELLGPEKDETRPAAAEQGIRVSPGGAAGQRVDGHRDQAPLPQRVRLVALQRKQRRYDDGRAAEGDGRDLVDGRLPRTAWQNGQAVAPGGQHGRRLLLS